LTFKENIPIIAEKNRLKKIFQLLQKKKSGNNRKKQDNTEKEKKRKYSGLFQIMQKIF
jgi:hypothetical protein